ncbi:hypothetical protein BDZ94DRAFT_1313416 [Collybia nuda]|uniref:Uncharacterized protein n=1 Tax=Collybia nuda TaxID=64659 RepID=A0A9P5XWZ0_9AGAR|nr:hypothetical protein BDZ94DRAFT_1313416 [Collybia nuda]
MNRLFDPEAQLPEGLQSRLDALKDNPPKSQFQIYGPLNAYLQGYKFPFNHFIVKPQALLRGEQAELYSPNKATPEPEERGRHSRPSLDSQGAWVTDAKRFPDFTVCQYWGDPQITPDIIRIIIEIGSDPQTIRKQINSGLEWAGERWKGRILGIGIVKNRYIMVHNKGVGFSAVGRGRWYSIFEPKFVTDLDDLLNYCLENDDPEEDEESNDGGEGDDEEDNDEEDNNKGEDTNEGGAEYEEYLSDEEEEDDDDDDDDEDYELDSNEEDDDEY